MTSQKTSLLPYITLVIGILCLSMTSIFVRWADAPGTITAAYRMIFAVLVLTPFVFKKGFVPLEKGSSLVWMIPAAGLLIALVHGTLNTAILLTRIANCVLLNNLAPVWVALFALMVWKEKIAKWFWVGLTLALAGAAVILGADLLRHPQLSLGDGLAFLASFFYAGYYLLTQSSRVKIPALQYIWLVNLFSAIALVLYNLIVGNALCGYSPLTWMVFAAAGIVPQAIGYFCIAYSLGHLSAAVVSPTLLVQIVITALIAIPLTGEELSEVQIMGGLIVLAGILIINLTRKKERG